MHTKIVQNVRIAAKPDHDSGWRTVIVPAKAATYLGWKSSPVGKALHGRVRHHRVIRNGELAELVRVFTCARGSILL